MRIQTIIGLVCCLCIIFSAGAALAQESDALSVAPADETANSLTTRVVQIFIAVTVLSLAPGIAMMVTCLPFMLVVLSILRQGVGLQQAPPNMLIVSVALFLTYFVMEPVFKDAWSAGVQPLLDGTISHEVAFEKTMGPFQEFMQARVSNDAVTILNDSRKEPVEIVDGRIPLSLLTPAFVLSEIQRAFEIGFVILLPFLIIDLLVASILMAMGMMMVPPAIVSLPFKVSFFVLTNGWIAVSGALVRGYS